MSEESDHYYRQKVLAGDRDAFRYFITTYQESALRLAFSMTQDETRAKDVVQRAFVQAYKSLRSFRAEAKFSTWLYRIVVNEAIKLNRKSGRERRTEPIAPRHHVHLTTRNGALDALELQEKRTRIHQALATMKPKERLMLELFYLREHSLAEIHAVTGFSLSNIKVLLHRARKNFAAIFQPLN